MHSRVHHRARSSSPSRQGGAVRRLRRDTAEHWQGLVRAVLCVAIGLQLCGCTSLHNWWHQGFKVGPNYVRPAAPIAPEWIDSDESRLKNEPAQDCAWWQVFNDPRLNGVVETAYAQNLDLRTAGTRILEARAQRNIAVGTLFPQSQTAMATYVHGQVSRNLGLPLPGQINLWADGFNASWELDFWGRYRRSIEAANADLAASTQRYGETLVLLLSEVASQYVQLRTYEERLVFAQKNVEVQQGSLKIAEDRFRAGNASELDIRQARTSLAQTEALIPPLVTGRRQAANQLCVLLGMPVFDLAEEMGAGAIPRAPVEVAVGLPADLLRRRPDVRRAEREVAAQSARIGVAESDLYPRLSLNGFIGFAADDFKDLFNANSFTAFAFPTLQWNILNYGRIANNVQLQDARLEGVALQYQQAVLKAGREVEDALVGFLQSQRQAAKLEQSVAESNRFVQLVVIQFRGGAADFNRVYNAQSSLVTLQDQMAVARGNIALNLIQVYRAMGGGWLHFMNGHGMPVGEAMPGQQAPPAVEEIPHP
jgi:NodT family efflux transporter outer membrane factor (OMF) lipoprotein